MLKILLAAALLTAVSAVSGITDIKTAITNGDIVLVKSMIEGNKDLLESRIDTYFTPLNFASLEGKTDLVKYLVDKGANISTRDREGSIPLQNAAIKGYFDIVKILVEKGSDVNYKDDNDVTPLHFACMSGNLELVKYLVEKGADVSSVSKAGRQPVFEAAWGGNLEMIKFLESKGADLKGVNSNGNTPLHFASRNGNMEFIEYILSKGYDINEKNNAGQAPIVWAVAGNTPEVIGFLKEKGADINAKDSDGRSLMFNAAARGSKETIELLQSYGLDINEKDNFGMTPLQSGIRGGIEILEYLLDKGAEIAPEECMSGNSCTIDGTTILHQAMYANNPEIVELLIKRKAPLNVIDSNGSTPLMIAVNRGSVDIAQLLLNNGADPDIKDTAYGRSALHIAASKGYDKIAALLISEGADVNITEKNGQTPLYSALYHGNDRIAKLLIKNKAENKVINDLQKGLEVNDGEAKIFYLGHSGWAVKTKDHLLLFDYWDNENSAKPGHPNINNGFLVPEELKNENVVVFMSHDHGDHYTPAMFGWKDKIENIKFVTGFDPKMNAADLNIVEGRKHLVIDGVDITTVPSTDTGVGFLVKTNGMTILHPGDHANMDRELKGPYVTEIDYLAGLSGKVDIAFFPVSGCNFRDQVALKSGVKYAIEKLNPSVVFPMHAGNNEASLLKFKDEAEADGVKADFYCAEYKGDRFIYSKSSSSIVEK
ncbi:MAG TPA: ankyrin repeat domain-containing protein [Clostridiales bacterium]|nr:ankyrin repeat domain-containing protein [Clostridiales bacterium]